MRIFTLVLVALLANLSQAHHSRSPFLLDETFEVEGFVTEVSWRSPHVYIVVEVPDVDGSSTEWTFEGHSIAGLMRYGWQADTFEPGDRVVVVANPNRNPDTQFGLLDNVTGIDGQTYYSFRVPPEAGGNPSRTPVAGSTDFSGAWNRQATLLQSLVGGFGVPEGYSVNARGQAMIDAFDLNDSPALSCEPASVPSITLAPYTHRWIREADRIVIEKDQSEQVRVIHLDGSPMPEDWVPDLLGYSVGHFEADGSLVVETTGFAPTTWGIVRGIDSSAAKKVTERFELAADGYEMKVSITVEDPEYLTEPHTRTGGYDKIRDHEFSSVPCDPETARRHLQFED